MAKIANVALTNTFDTWRVRSNEAFDRLSQFAIDNSKLYANTLTANVSFVSRGNAVFAGSTSNTLVRITQTGTGNALLVEDSANPDITPFVVDSNGRVVLGNISALTLAGATPPFQYHSTVSTQAAIAGWSTTATSPPILGLYRSASGVVGTQGAVVNGSDLGAINFFGDDGTAFIPSAQILAEVDGTPGTSDMPGRLTFSTTADGAAAVTERMRIDSTGDVGIGTTNPTARLNVVDATSQDAVRITQTGTGNALVVEDSANPDSNPFVIDANGRVLVGTATVITTAALGTAFLQVTGDGNERPQISVSRFSADNDRPRFTFIKSRSASVGTNTIVQSGDSLGEINFLGADGSGSTGYPIAAQIASFVDGTPGSSDMPGRLTFSTTADGAAAPTERMRISADGNVGIGASPSEALTVSRSTGETVIGIRNTGTASSWLTLAPGSSGSAYIHNVGNTSTIFTTNGTEKMRITSAGSVGIGTSSPAATLDVVGTVSVARANVLNQTLTDGATINWNTASGQVATVTLGGSRIMAAPTNLRVGTYILHVIQDATGSRTLTWNSVFKWTAGVAPPLTTTANARDVFSFVSDGTNLYGSFIPDVR
jgi:hypothetical protein